MKKEWRLIINYENSYKISNFGDVVNIRTKKLLKKSLGSRNKYFTVGLQKDKKQKRYYIHRLVLLTFVGPPPPNYICCHNDGNSLNNRLDNLRWDTSFNNSMDKVNHKSGIKKPMYWDMYLIKILNEIREGIIV